MPLFGTYVWWRAVEVTTNHVKVESILRRIGLLIIGFISTTPIKAIFAILNWIPKDHQARKHVLYMAISLDVLCYEVRPRPYQDSTNLMEFIGYLLMDLNRNLKLEWKYTLKMQVRKYASC